MSCSLRKVLINKGKVVPPTNYTFSGNWSDNDELITGVTDITNSSPAVPEDFFNYRKEWGRSVFDRPHRLAVTYLYEIPWFSSGWMSQSLSKVFGGWQIAGFTDMQSGHIPVNGTGTVTAPLGPNGLLANSMPGGGNLGRNTFRGPGFQQWNFSLSKSVKVRETMQLQVRADFGNLWNHRNFPNPVAVMSSTSFGQNTGNLIGDGVRTILFNAKLKF